jgi:hypothetical protein
VHCLEGFYVLLRGLGWVAASVEAVWGYLMAVCGFYAAEVAGVLDFF